MKDSFKWQIFDPANTREQAIDVAKFHGTGFLFFSAILLLVAVMSSQPIHYLACAVCLLAGYLVSKRFSRLGGILALILAIYLTFVVVRNIRAGDAEGGLAPVILFWIMALRSMWATVKLNSVIRADPETPDC